MITVDRRKFDARAKALIALAKNIESNPLWIDFATRVVSAAKDMAPVDSGYMRDTIKYDFVEDGVLFSASSGYSLFVEYGTVNQSAQPFLGPALEEHRNHLKQLIERAFNGK